MKQCLVFSEQEDTENLIMPRLTTEKRARAVGMLEAGMTQRQVAHRMGCCQSTIFKLADRYGETGTVKDRPRSGRPRVTTTNQDRNIVLQHLQESFRPATATAAATPGQHNPRISAPTVRRRLHSRGLSARRPCKGPILTPVNGQNRLR